MLVVCCCSYNRTDNKEQYGVRSFGALGQTGRKTLSRRNLPKRVHGPFAPVQLPVGFKEGETPAPALPGVNEVTFSKTPIRIPSPWNVNSFADKNGLGGDHLTYPSYPKEWESIKMGWLQKKFTVPASWKGKRIQIHFEAVAGKADIYVNGKVVGDNLNIFMPFDIDITDAVKFQTGKYS